MKDEKEINVSVACHLGWHIPERDWPTLMGYFQGGDIRTVPDYSADANTRPEMLASLTRAEKERVIQMALSPLAESFGIQVFDIIRILELDQPTFARLFCKVKGLL